MTMSYNMKKERAIEIINTSFTHTNIHTWTHEQTDI